MRKISQIEGHVTKTNISGEIVRYHSISAALTTVKYDLLTLYVTIRSGRLTAMKTSFLYPILSDTQRWLTHAYHQIKIVLSSFPGSNKNHRSTQRSTIRLQKTIEQSQISLTESPTEQSIINENP